MAIENVQVQQYHLTLMKENMNSPTAKLPNITILGDSRAFDTYYLNDEYDQYYGYDQTFPFLLRREVLRSNQLFDVAHIPDHFRGGSIENNILRIAMTDPSMVYLLDGIWETLLNKSHFIEYANKAIDEHSLRSGDRLNLNYSHEDLAKLYDEDSLSISPTAYARRIYKITSYFVRRRRPCVWMNLTIPSANYRDGIHYAGNYRPSPFWNSALKTVNQRVGEKVRLLGENVFDLDRLMIENGGEHVALVDQWHFTAKFHQIIATEMLRDISPRMEELALPHDHVSHRHMLPNRNSGDSVLVFGDNAQECCATNSGVKIFGIAKKERELPNSPANIILLAMDDSAERDTLSEVLLDQLPSRQIILFPEEFNRINNPMGPR
jgi:hypothetical protein